MLSLIVLLPLAMRQIHLGFGGEAGIFEFKEGAEDSLITWLSFFGLELAKAVPFVDWADIYDVETVYVVEASSPAAHHVVFAARAVVDLVFLAALLQAISISLKLSRHKRMFFDREIDLLDPMIERLEFEKLAIKRDGEWTARAEIASFQHYDPVALARVRARYPSDSPMHAVATAIKNSQNQFVSTPSERFLEACSMSKPIRKEVLEAWREAVADGPIPIEFIDSARQSLNWNFHFNSFRQILVRRIVSMPLVGNRALYERNRMLRNTLVGKNQDSKLDVRILTLMPLARTASYDPKNIRVLEMCAHGDPSMRIRRIAAELSRRRSEFPPEIGQSGESLRRDPDGDEAQGRTIPVLGTID
ncbi:MAG: hypothetical protein RLN70_10780 [Rhodospirillaceae bacterium]